MLRQKNLPDLRGGLPKIDPHIDIGLISANKVPIVMDRGTKNFSARGEIKMYNGSNQITYKGKQAWPKPVDINGTLNFLTDPLANQKDITIYMNEQLRNIGFKPKRTETDHQFVVNRLEWDSSNFNTDLKEFDSMLSGVNNLSRFKKFPWTVSLPNYREGRYWLTECPLPLLSWAKCSQAHHS